MHVTLSATLAANQDIERRRRAGQRVLHLAFGEAGLPVHPALRARLADASGNNGYGQVAGSPALREAAAGYWTRRDLPTDPDLVVCGPGSKSLLFGLLLAIGADGPADIVLPMPSWVSYAAQAEIIGVRPIMVPAPPGEGGVPDPDLVASAVLHARAQGRTVRSLLVTLPDNPTGRLARPGTIRRLAQIARDLDLVIISDEIYRDLVHDPVAEYLSPAEVAPERTIITSGLSKSLAVGGWRIGMARLSHTPAGWALRDRLLAVASEIWSSPAAPVQHAAAYALTEPAEIVQRVNESRRLHGLVARAVADRFTKAGASVHAPQGGFYLYPEISGFESAAELAHTLIEQHGVGVLPGSAFGDNPRAPRVRVATSLLYGDTPDQRLTTLHADDPLTLPWVAESLIHLESALADLTAARHPSQRRIGVLKPAHAVR
ncbi:aminotransferase class I/II-fold pyridoxal phosphate-dependent enzyme [Acrocarpospora macrocephala]|uniref:Aminotransferase n=1 Tax=Acrocarpospora macrocephala TaxID=150177 RepID=A0A5M3WUC9_9ACTN|nr:pyridoxal phosphate-dependent aminotransferase [Acrocarpospora macrocephala]GES12136.1 aminopeptidase [Acrocarpospora macrocephala]